METPNNPNLDSLQVGSSGTPSTTSSGVRCRNSSTTPPSPRPQKSTSSTATSSSPSTGRTPPAASPSPTSAAPSSATSPPSSPSSASSTTGASSTSPPSTVRAPPLAVIVSEWLWRMGRFPAFGWRSSPTPPKCSPPSPPLLLRRIRLGFQVPGFGFPLCRAIPMLSFPFFPMLWLVGFVVTIASLITTHLERYGMA